MIFTSTLGYPRIGIKRELKFALEDYWAGRIDIKSLLTVSESIQINNWSLQRTLGIDQIPSNDFSFYDHVLDTAILVSAIPSRFLSGELTDEYSRYFAMARGLQNATTSIHAMEMTKWFNTNYHFIVPEISHETSFRLNIQKPLNAFNLAKTNGFITHPVILGPVSFLLLSKPVEPNFTPLEKLPELLPIYQQLFTQLKDAGVSWIQLDEPFLASDLDQNMKVAFQRSFMVFESSEARPNVMLATYFDDIEINKETVSLSPFEGLHIDLASTQNPLDLIRSLPKYQTLSIGVVNGRNIWKTDLVKQSKLISDIMRYQNQQDLLLSTSCSMIHIPQDLELETEIKPEIKSRLSFARQKLQELSLLKLSVTDPQYFKSQIVSNNLNLSGNYDKDTGKGYHSVDSTDSLSSIPADKRSTFSKRKKKQQLSLPLFPTTTIGSFPQTREVRTMRAKFVEGEITRDEYEVFIKSEISKVIHLQEEIGLDVLVHGEFERNDMVQYFAEKMKGFTLSSNGWVQSFGSRYVRPPIIFGPVSRPLPMTVEWIKYAQSLTEKPVKGMLTGPVTILQWSFVRDDQPRSSTCRQIALAIRDEVLDLEAAGIQIIQIDEPALREGLPMKKEKWNDYLTWAVDCFKIAAGSVQDETQIHTHMCYAEFNDIIEAIGKMDADVISIEASRSNMELLNAFSKYHYPNDIGPGTYDIHSPIIPKTDEIVRLIKKALEVIPCDQLWVNPDCGLKTRSWEEVIPSLKAMVHAAKLMRKKKAGKD